MNILLLYFSGTGNTAWVTERINREFTLLGHKCSSLPLEDILLGKTMPDWDSYELFGLGFPVHAMDAPRLVYDLLPFLPAGRHNYFLYKTAGSIFAYGGSTRRLRHALARRGWIIKHESVFEMPPNMGGTARPEKVQERIDRALREIPIAVSQILNDDKVLLPDYGWMRLVGLVNRLECHGLPRMSKRWKASSACIRCGKCVKLCPTGNISLSEDGIQFSDKCVFCLRCWWNCPTQALENPFVKPFLLKEKYTLSEQ